MDKKLIAVIFVFLGLFLLWARYVGISCLMVNSVLGLTLTSILAVPIMWALYLIVTLANSVALRKDLFKISISITILSLYGAVVLLLHSTTDHSETIKKVAEPMLEQMDAFYKKNHRHPNKERNKLLVASGCSKVQNEECYYGWKRIKIVRDTVDNKNYHRMTLNYDNTYCHFGVTSKGKLEHVVCFNSPCIDWNA